MSDTNIIKDVIPPTKISPLHKNFKERNFKLKKRKKFKDYFEDNKSKPDINKLDTDNGNGDFVEDVKDALMYGDVGHGVLLDKKV
jgi:hypothetical protein